MIHLANNYYLDADAYSYAITERKIYESGSHIGEEYFTPLSFYTTLRGVVEATNELLARDGVMHHWNKTVTSRAYMKLNEALKKINEPGFDKAFFSKKKKYTKNA